MMLRPFTGTFADAAGLGCSGIRLSTSSDTSRCEYRSANAMKRLGTRRGIATAPEHLLEMIINTAKKPVPIIIPAQRAPRALQVAGLQHIAVDDADMTHASTGQVNERRAAEAASADDQYATCR